jgi:hypothetical protein
VGVIHRDLTPGNVLCCGFGEAEIFKISDFGVARPHGLTETFGGLGVGTAGYAAPEQSAPDRTQLGPYTDNFGFACVIYYLLTGDHYFEANSPVQAYTMARDKHRRSITESPALSPEFAERKDLCRAIDSALARATSFAPDQRPQGAQELASTLIPWLGDPSSAPRPSRRLVQQPAEPRIPRVSSATGPGPRAIRPRRRHHPERGLGHGRALLRAHAAGSAVLERKRRGCPRPEVERSLPSGMAFARRYEAGGWLLGGAGGTLAVYNTDGVREILRAPDPTVTFSHASGRFDDLIAAVGAASGEAPTLWAMAARRWMKPMRLDGVSYVAAPASPRDDIALRRVAGRLSATGQAASVIANILRAGGGGGADAVGTSSYIQTPAHAGLSSAARATEPKRSSARCSVGADGVSVRLEGERGVTSTRRSGLARFDTGRRPIDVLEGRASETSPAPPWASFWGAIISRVGPVPHTPPLAARLVRSRVAVRPFISLMGRRRNA